MVQPHEQVITWAALWGARRRKQLSNCPVDQWFKRPPFSAPESKQHKKWLCWSLWLQIPTSQSCFRGLTVWFKRYGLRVCQAVILLNKSNMCKIYKWLLLSSLFDTVCFNFRTPEIAFNIMVVMTFFFYQFCFDI